MAASINIPRLRRIAGRFFWRPTPAIKALGFSNVALGADLPRAAIEAQRLNEAVERARRETAVAAAPGSVEAVIADYLASEWFSAKAPATRIEYRRILERLREAFGRIRVDAITRQDLRRLATSMRYRPRAARDYLKLLSIVLSHSIELGLRTDNPALRMRLPGSPKRETTWTPEQVAGFRAAAIKAGRPSIGLAVALAYETAQRPTDILRLPWSALSGNVVTLRQSKTGRQVAVTISQALASELSGLERRSPVIVVSEATGRPYAKRAVFARLFRRIATSAGLPRDLTFRDLRRTALTEAGRGGATLHELQSLGGHSTLTTLPRYVVPSSEAAERAGQKRAKGGKSNGDELAKGSDAD